ncbi:recombinase family protein [Chitinophaga sp. CF418]|uniref:recombinase family protein n=1 Tax=Chitinophaga sp. CF418 TaxID=1855287 RepID=UPI001CB7C239
MYGNYSKTEVPKVSHQAAIVYTRVSSKEQADHNLSLDVQRKAIEDFAQRSDLNIIGYFGGTYESAKTDGRKEFTRMLEFIKKHKGKVSHVLVYTLDRFSRTGGAAIKLAEELREKYGVTVYAVTQPADTSNPSGVLQQSIHFIFSQYDNQLRKQRAMAGMKEKFDKGIWVTKPPQGYDIVRTNGQRKIVVNEVGKKLRKAFIWKAEGIKNDEIISRLRAMGVKMYKQQLTKIFKRPFYCGVINHGLLEGKIVEGNHEKLISKEIFLKVNDIHQSSGGYGVPHKKEQDEVPLKIFIRCDTCHQPFTGYVVKAKGLWYYKCRTEGCKCNKSAKRIHELFGLLLHQYRVDNALIGPLKSALLTEYNEMNKEGLEQQIFFNNQLKEINIKIDNLEESRYVLKEISQETFDKFHPRYIKEQENILKQLAKFTQSISNPEEAIEQALLLSCKLPVVWSSSDAGAKEKLQKLIFPDGIVYDRKNESFRTPKVNTIFSRIAHLSGNSPENEKGTNHTCDDLSLLAEKKGFSDSLFLYCLYVVCQ